MYIEFNILIGACFIIMAGFFSGMETGIYVLDPLRYHVKVRHGEPPAKLLERLLRRKSDLVTSLLVGTNICIFLVTIFATRVVEYYCHGRDLAFQAIVTTVFTTAAVLVFAEMLPKNIYRSRANTIVYSSARAFYIANIFFLPVVKALSVLTGAVNLLFGRRGSLENEFLTRKSVEYHLTSESGRSALTQSQMKMVRNIMKLPVKNLISSMIALRDTVMVHESTSREKVLELFRKKRFSRMPVYRDSRTDVIGVFNIFDLFYESHGNAAGKGDKEASGIKHLIRPIPLISRSARIDEALVVLREERQPMGLVFGPKKTAIGIVTVKDLLEEITGEIGAW